MEKFYLFPGAVFASKVPHIVDTVLGSCIAVTLWNPILQFGSINHFMLPEWNGEGTASNKYGDVAISYQIKKMLELGSKKCDLKAKVFGGSEINNYNGVFQIGLRNTEIAFEILKSEKIPVISHNVGGNLSRKVIFYSESGDVLIRFINPLKPTEMPYTKPKY